MPAKASGRELGSHFPGKPGVGNAITDVPGVGVGFCTLNENDPDYSFGWYSAPRDCWLDDRKVDTGAW